MGKFDNNDLNLGFKSKRRRRKTGLLQSCDLPRYFIRSVFLSTRQKSHVLNCANFFLASCCDLEFVFDVDL